MLLGAVLIGFPLWGAVDAAAHPSSMWERIGLRREVWIWRQALLAPFVVGFAMAVTYFVRVRPRLAGLAFQPIDAS